jgi:hypothetical protein
MAVKIAKGEFRWSVSQWGRAKGRHVARLESSWVMMHDKGKIGDSLD